MSYGDRLAPFRAIDGLGFWVGSNPYLFQGGQYGSGEGAVVILAADGQVETKLTVSLANYGAPALEVGELWVKLPDEDAPHDLIQRELLSLGFFTADPRTVSMGRVERYAQRWSFARCTDRSHKMVEISYRVECAECRAHFEKLFEDGRVRLLAKDTVRMIKRMGNTPDGW